MKRYGENIFESMTDIDEVFIEEAAARNPVHKRGIKRRMLWPIIIGTAVCLCGFSYQMHAIIGAGYTKEVDESQLAQPFETASADSGISGGIESGEKHHTTTLIDNIDDVYATDFQTISLDGGHIESVYFSPSYMIILSDKGNAWKADTDLVDADSVMEVNFHLQKGQSLYIEYGYIDNGVYHEDSLVKGNAHSFEIPLQKGHEYYPCISNRSSENAIIAGGSVMITEKENK